MNLCQNVCHYEQKENSKVGRVGSKTRLLGKIREKSCVHSRSQSFGLICMKLCPNACHQKSRTNLKLGYVGSKSRSLDQILKKRFYTLIF